MPWDILFLLNYWIWLPALMVLLGVLWLVHLYYENAALAEVGFCGGFLLLVLACGFSSDGDFTRRMLITGMGSVYAIRLGTHIFAYRFVDRPEDARYRRLRQLFGNREQSGMFLYFLFQVPGCIFFAGLLCWLMSHPHANLTWWDGVGLGLYLLAIGGEAIADRQLDTFRANPSNRGKTLRAGLWRYSRHPNYFFESLHWWAYVPMAVGLPWWSAAIIWPLLMTGSLLWITGIPWAEAQALARRGEEYREYQRITSPFIPWFPRE